MKNPLLIAGIVILLTLVVLYAGLSISYGNQYVRMVNLLKAKQTDNTSEFDNMWKKIQQTAQVSEKERDSLKDIFNSYAQARTGGDNNQLLMKWIHESIPQVTPDLFKNLQNIITASRDSWTMRQKELIAMKMELDNLLETFPGSFLLSGKPTVEIKVITSSKTEKTFDSGKDDDVNLFGASKTK